MRRVMVRDWISILLAIVAIVGVCDLGAQEAAQPPQEKSGAEKKEEIERKEAKPEEIEEIRVVAPPLIEGNTVNRLGSEVTTVGRQQIEDLNALDLPSALRATPGVTISRRNLVGGVTGGDTIYIRGMGSRQPGGYIMPMVDGVPRYKGIGHKLMFDLLSVNIADAIDVYKGAQPVLFGAGALSAINIRTKRREKEGFEGRVEGAGGSYGTWYEEVEQGGKLGPFDYYLVHSIRGSSGHRPQADGKVEEWFGRAGLDVGQHFNAAFTINHTDSWARDPGPDDEPPPERAKFKVFDTSYLCDLTNTFDMADGYLKFYYSDGEIDYEQFGPIKAPGMKKPADLYYENHPSWDDWGIRFQEKVQPWKGGEVILGLDYDVEVAKFEQDCATGDIWSHGRERFYITQPYLAVSQMLGDRDSWYAIPSGGTRFNRHSKFQNRWTPQAGMILGYKKTEGHVYYARNVSYAPLTTLFNYDRWNVPYLQGRSISDLLPEVVDHYEVGLSHRFTNWLKGDATLFCDRGRNDWRFITLVPTGKKADPIRYYGRPQSWHSDGVELTATLTPFRDVTIFGGTTFLHARSQGDALPGSPEITFMSGLTWRFLDRFQLNLDAEYIGQQYRVNPREVYEESTQVAEQVGGYFLMNGKLSCRVTPDDSKVKGTVFVAVQNLTDTNYELYDHYPAPPASFLIGGELKF